MNDDKTPSGCGADDRELHALVIQHNAQARMTFQLARQLAAHLPIGSFDKLGVILKDVTVDNHRLPLELFAPHASEALFPIKSADDLVRKLSAAVRMGLAQGQRGGAALVAPPPVLTLLEDAQGVELGRRAPIPAGHFTGPSIYGVTHAKGG